jgi:rare lipoprotein A (peptidoglycan hydrolase)
MLQELTTLRDFVSGLDAARSSNTRAKSSKKSVAKKSKVSEKPEKKGKSQTKGCKPAPKIVENKYEVLNNFYTCIFKANEESEPCGRTGTGFASWDHHYKKFHKLEEYIDEVMPECETCGLRVDSQHMKEHMKRVHSV